MIQERMRDLDGLRTGRAREDLKDHFMIFSLRDGKTTEVPLAEMGRGRKRSIWEAENPNSKISLTHISADTKQESGRVSSGGTPRPGSTSPGRWCSEWRARSYM